MALHNYATFLMARPRVHSREDTKAAWKRVVERTATPGSCDDVELPDEGQGSTADEGAPKRPLLSDVMRNALHSSVDTEREMSVAVSARYNLAMLHQADSDMDGAQELLEGLLAIEPGHKAAKEALTSYESIRRRRRQKAEAKAKAKAKAEAKAASETKRGQ